MHFHDSIEEVSMVLYAHVDPLSSATCRSYHDPSCFTYTTISRHKLPETSTSEEQLDNEIEFFFTYIIHALLATIYVEYVSNTELCMAVVYLV